MWALTGQCQCCCCFGLHSFLCSCLLRPQLHPLVLHSQVACCTQQAESWFHSPPPSPPWYAPLERQICSEQKTLRHIPFASCAATKVSRGFSFPLNNDANQERLSRGGELWVPGKSNQVVLEEQDREEGSESLHLGFRLPHPESHVASVSSAPDR